MRLLTILLASLSLSACVTKTEYIDRPVPVYLTVHPDKPEPPDVGALTWVFLPEQGYFALEIEDFDQYRKNLAEYFRYMVELQRGWQFYEDATSKR